MEKILANLKYINDDDLPVFKKDLENLIEFYMEPHDKCLEALNERPMDYIEIIEFFNFLKDETDLVKEFMYLSNHNGGITSEELWEYITEISPIECAAGFLQNLTNQCKENQIDLYGDMIYFQDENGFIYFMTNEQLTKRIIKPWVRGDWFILENYVVTKLHRILTKP